MDCSPGGNVTATKVPIGPGYKTPFAERIRRDTSIPTAAVGMITTPNKPTTPSVPAKPTLSSSPARCSAPAPRLSKDDAHERYNPAKCGHVD